MKMELTVSSETSAIRTQTSGNYPKRNKLNYGTSSDPIMKKKGHDEDVRLKAPKYKLPQRSMQQFEAWLESSEEVKKNKNFIP